MKARTFLHSGKCGDVVYSLPTVRALGGGHLFLRPAEELGFTASAAQALLPLLIAQPYITGAGLWNGPTVDVLLDRFRQEDRPTVTNIADAHLRAFGLSRSEKDEPWLTVTDAPRHGRVVFARSLLRHGVPGFWRAASKRFSDAVFVGTRGEHQAIQEIIGSIEFHETPDFLDLGRFLAGSLCVVANQSAPYAIAEGLKVATVQEVDTWAPNCVFNRSNAYYVSTERSVSQLASGTPLIGNCDRIGIATLPIIHPGPHAGRLSKPTKPGTSVVVPTHNAIRTIDACVASAVGTMDVNDELILVDNCSTDGTREWLADNGRGKFLVSLMERDLGSSAAVNVGILLSKGDSILVLNPRTQLFAGCLERMRSRFADPSVAAVGPVCNHAAGWQYVEHHLPPGAPRMSKQSLEDHFRRQYSGRSMETKLLTGMCIMLKRRDLDRYGLFDESLFLGVEDLELSWRLRACGMRLIIARDTFVHYDGDLSLDSISRSDGQTLLEASARALVRKLHVAYSSPGEVSSTELWDIGFFPCERDGPFAETDSSKV